MKKKKLLAVLAVVFVAALISGVAAWLSDDASNTVEVVPAKVSIALRESNWRPENASDVHPEDVLPKNPTVTNTGTSDVYVFVEVSMSALKAGTQIADTRALMELRAPMPLYTTRARNGEYDGENWQRLVGPLYDKEKNSITWIYSYSRKNVLTPLAPEGTTSALFDSVQLANVTRRDDVEGLDANIYVHAYAIQTEQLGTGGKADGPGAVWNIVSNSYSVKLAAETLPVTVPRIIRLLPSAKPTKAPKPTPTPTPDPDAVAFYGDADMAADSGTDEANQAYDTKRSSGSAEPETTAKPRAVG